jgi:hypothetical protein
MSLASDHQCRLGIVFRLKMGKKLIVRHPICFFLAMVLACNWTLAVPPALALGPDETPLIESPAPPTTCGPSISDTCIPIEEHHAKLQVLGALYLYTASFSRNWRPVTAGGDVYTFQLPVKFTYGFTKNLEAYIVVPYIINWVNRANITGPDGNTSAGYNGIGDITAVAKYNFRPEGDICPAMAAVGGIGVPTGHSSHLNARFLGQDAIGTGSVNFITGINLYKLVKPFLLYSNIWLNTPINVNKERGSFGLQPVRNRENVTFNLATEYPLNKQWILLLEMYSTWTWENPGTELLGFQSPATVVGFLPGIEFVATKKWSFTVGCAFDAVGKFPASRAIVPQVSWYYNF